MIEAQNEDKRAENLANMSIVIPRSKGSIVENSGEKLERKALIEERKHERSVEKQKISDHMENLMSKVLLFILNLI